MRSTPLTPEQLCDLFAELDPRLETGALADFGGLSRGTERFCAIRPATPKALSAAVRLARLHGAPLRTRGMGHSLNGSSLPQPGEVLVRMDRFGGARFERPGTVTAGAGLVAWTLDALLARHGLALPVKNDGYDGPSVGGLIAAGGYGHGALRHGGLWQNVASVSLIDGHGEPRHVERDDPLFPWLFGAMGQLGIVYEAVMDAVQAPGARAPYPFGVSVSTEEVAASPSLRGPGPPREEAGKHVFWFTWFVPGNRLVRALALLKELQAAHMRVLRPFAGYQTPVSSHGRVVPMLLFPHASPFFAVGIWGWADELSDGLAAELRALDEALSRAARENGFHRYLQTEIAAGPERYRLHFGDAIYSELSRWKAELDPACLFNRGSVFLYDPPASEK